MYIIIYIYLYANRSYILNTGRSFCVLECDIALAGSGYITSSNTKLRSYILYIGPISILYNIHTYKYYIYIYMYIL